MQAAEPGGAANWASRAAVRAAADLLRDAWAPGPVGRIDILGELLPPGSSAPACDCGNRDANGELRRDGRPGTDPACTHTRFCYCDQCVHGDHLAQATCAMPRCERPTRIQITRWSVRPWSQDPPSNQETAGDEPAGNDPASGPATGDEVGLEADGTFGVGDNLRQHPRLFACGTLHARQLIDDDRRRHEPPGRCYYEARGWTYEPDQVDVTAPINQVPGHLDFAQWHAQTAMAALFAGDHEQHNQSLADARQSLAWAVSALAAHTEQLEDPGR
ncbi:hypothetical protein ACFV9C_42585 [Kribbella sp. NPDC059898]|uniref:hypothetical protein n=1 Tax=Kribbella sp. NPDC059898 TaxID=3346995 RepID=UPI00365D24F2